MTTSVLYPTPQDAEAAFYEALERGDLDAMMNVWADEEEIYCIHPGGARLVGHASIREAFRQIFTSGQRMQVQVGHQIQTHGMMLAIHCVHEFISVPGQGRAANPMVATNVYQRTGNGWRMVAHHASPAPALERPKTRVERPRTLH